MTRNVKNFIKGGLMASFGTFGFFLAIWLILDFFKAIGALYTVPILAFIILFIAGGFVYMTYWNKP